MKQLLQIAQLGHPILRKIAKLVDDKEIRHYQNLISDMLATLNDGSGVGIAAPQVFQSVRIIIVASHPNSRYPNAPMMKPTPCINPEIISYSDNLISDWEGCLSVPGIRGLIPRYESVTVKFMNKNGKTVIKKYSGFISRIFQHEIDHLDGLLFVDRILSGRDLISEKEFFKLISKSNKPHHEKTI
jgi:peptide deformylase